MVSLKAPFRVLLTDDDEGDRLVFREIINEIDSNIIVSTVNDGKQLMDYLGNEDNPRPHIIYLDLNMPIMNGLECLKEIRCKKHYHDISIAIYSTSTSESDIEDSFQYGANIYITKPSKYNMLKQVLTKSLAAARLNRDSEFERSNFVLKI